MAVPALAHSDTPLPFDEDRIVVTLFKLGVRYIVAEAGAEPYEGLPPEELIEGCA